MTLESVASVGLEVLNRKELGSALNGLMGGARLFNNIFEKQKNHALLSAPGTTSAGGQTSTMQALIGLKTFDSDGNGQISRQELETGLQTLPDNNATARLKALGQKLLQNYDKAAVLDGNASGVSLGDIARLAGRDGQAISVSAADWQKLQS